MKEETGIPARETPRAGRGRHRVPDPVHAIPHGGKADDCWRVQVPANWQSVASNRAIKFVPPNAYGDYNGEAGKRAAPKSA